MTREELIEDLKLLIHWEPTPERRREILKEAITQLEKNTVDFGNVGPSPL